MQYMKKSAAICVAWLAFMADGFADDTLKVAVAQRGAWETAAAELGQQAGIFKKHGVALDLLYTSEAEAEQQVVSSTVAVSIGVNPMAIIHAYARGAPVRIIGAARSGDASYWYVSSASPIHAVNDLGGKTIAFEKNGSSSQYAAFDLIKQFGVKARLASTGEMPATLQDVMSGRVDVGWATPPFGLQEIGQGDIRVVARANDVAEIRGKTASVMIASADTRQKRKAAFVRFMRAYRETIEWMYSDPASLLRYAEFANLSQDVARRLRQDFLTKDMLWPDRIAGLKSIIKDAVTLRYVQTRLSRKQAAELVQIPQVPPDQKSACESGRADCTPVGLIRPF